MNFQQGSVELIDLTPDMAQTLLDMRPSETSDLGQRKINKGHVQRLVDTIESGQFVWLGNPLRLNANNELIDGQHRCTAVVKSGVTIPNMLLVTTYTPEAIMYLDTTSRVRTARDIRYITKRRQLHSAVTSAILFVETNFVPRAPKKLLPKEKVELTDKCEYIDELTQLYARSRVTGFNITSGVLAAAYAAMKIDYGMAMEFFGAIAEFDKHYNQNATLYINWHTRERSISGRTSGEVFRWDAADKAIRSWNAFRKGKKLNVLQSGRTKTMVKVI